MYCLSPCRCAHTHTVGYLAHVMFEAQVSSFSVCVALLGEGLSYTIADRYSATVLEWLQTVEAINSSHC